MENITPKMTMKLEMLPNTGHHYFFIPLTFATANEKQFKRALDVLKANNPWRAIIECSQGIGNKSFHDWLNKVCLGDNYPWKDYTDSRDRNWVRYRLGRMEAYNKSLPDMLGIWLALESNIGDAARGIEKSSDVPNQTDVENVANLPAPPKPYVYTQEEFDRGLKDLSFTQDFQNILSRIVKEKGSDPDGTPEWEVKFGELPGVEISWLEKKGKDINVDLIIDFGNSRSTVIAMNNASNVAGAAGDNLFTAVTFDDELDRTWDIEPVADGLVDSYLVLREPVFNDFHELVKIYDMETHLVETGFFIKKTHEEKKLKAIVVKQPQKFAQLSVAAIGSTVQHLLSNPSYVERIADNGSYVQSSPKRYYWDTDEHGVGGQTWWRMFPQPWHRGNDYKLNGEMLEYCPLDGSDWNLDNPPTKWPTHQQPLREPAEASYPRCDTMTWMALAILEKAYRQLNSPLHGIRQNFDGIYLTYPSGWTQTEISQYKAKWQTAMNIFYLTHMDPQLPCPKVEMEVDEAVASQLPFVFSEISKLEPEKAVGGKRSSELWLETVGRCNQQGIPHARVMTMDIGGGTADMSIIDYEEMNRNPNIPDKDLKATLLFKDSLTTAGDELVKKIIEKIVLPAITGNDLDTMKRWNEKQGAGDVNRKQLVLRQVLVPIVRFWMGQTTKDLDQPFLSPTGQCYSAQEMGIESTSWNSLMEILEMNQDSAVPITVTEEQFRDCVQDIFGGKFIKHVARILSCFGVDVIVICGKVSELPDLKDIFQRFLPLSSNRLVFMKDYYVGDWYPRIYNRHGNIRDPKTVTVAGAALHHGFRSNLIAGDWSLTYDNTQFSCRNNWRFYGAGFFLLRDNEQDEVTLTNINGEKIICRSMINSGDNEEPVYKLRMKRSWQKKTGNFQLTSLTLKRVMVDYAPEDGQADGYQKKYIIGGNKAEGLELVSAEGEFVEVNHTRTPITAEDLELYLHPMLDDNNWQESTKLSF